MTALKTNGRICSGSAAVRSGNHRKPSVDSDGSSSKTAGADVVLAAAAASCFGPYAKVVSQPEVPHNLRKASITAIQRGSTAKLV
ncbi:hypothetical protein P8C59_000267 [Phyllachora maydis]|uniref:Uncharacterized protein n=1 Tax=Phyllachora maydis TaxID=1825666 RepID=A0AAD9HWW7_9PEZI|nr:hypothetical protein P8C59_000267 [Phyllachora maydis]